MLKVYWADAWELNMPDTALFSDYRRKKLSAIKPEEARGASACAEMLLIEALRHEDPSIRLPLPVKADENGKPYLPEGGFCFSLSHSSHYAACAISDRPLGLDIQLLTGNREAVSKRFFTQGEQEYIQSDKDRDAAFTRLWCRKESFLKAIGLGLRMDLKSFDVSGAEPVLRCGGADCVFRETRIGDLFFCICAQKDALRLDGFPELIRVGG